MKEEIDCGLPDFGQPFSWAIRAGGVLYTTHGPVTPEGKILQAGIEEQAALTLANLVRAVEAAGGTAESVVQATVYILDIADMAPVDEAWRRVFSPPWPNRATLIVAGLVAPGMRIEVQATAVLG